MRAEHDHHGKRQRRCHPNESQRVDRPSSQGRLVAMLLDMRVLGQGKGVLRL